MIISQSIHFSRNHMSLKGYYWTQATKHCFFFSFIHSLSFPQHDFLPVWESLLDGFSGLTIHTPASSHITFFLLFFSCYSDEWHPLPCMRLLTLQSHSNLSSHPCHRHVLPQSCFSPKSYQSQVFMMSPYIKGPSTEAEEYLLWGPLPKIQQMAPTPRAVHCTPPVQLYVEPPLPPTLCYLDHKSGATFCSLVSQTFHQKTGKALLLGSLWDFSTGIWHNPQEK